MAAKKTKTLFDYEGWHTFRQRFAYDLNAFSIAVCQRYPTPQQEELFYSVEESGSRTSVSSGHGCFGKGTPILMADGSVKAVEDVSVNDRLMGGDGNSYRNVVGLCRGHENMYRFTYRDKTTDVFNESHILRLVATNSKGRRKSGDKVSVTVREWLEWGEDKKRCHAAYRSGVEAFENGLGELPIPPYVLGLWLGDGHSRDGSFTTMDSEIVDVLSKYAETINCDWVDRDCGNAGRARTYGISRGDRGNGVKNPFIQSLKELGIFKNKHVPQIYLSASKEARYELLAGIIDTDGHYDKGSNGYEVIQKSKVFAEQICFLFRSLGCYASINEKISKCGSTGTAGTYWRVYAGRNVHHIPVRLPRKKITPLKRARTNLHLGIKSCEPLGEGEYFGFEIDGDRSFLGGDFMVKNNTGKTGAIGVLVLWHLLCYPLSNTIVTAPRIAQVKNLAWKEITDMKMAMQKTQFAWLADEIVIESERIYIKGFKAGWYVIAKTAPKGSPENLAGEHRDHLLWIVDEASGVDDEHYGVMTGALTDERNRMLLTSQPTKPSGFFYETHHKLACKNGGVWNALTFNSEQSLKPLGLVSPDFIAEKKLQYTESEYEIKVQGRFPDKTDGFLLGRKEVDDAFGKCCISNDDEWGWMTSTDIGGGDYRDKSVLVQAKVVGEGDYGENARKVHISSVPLYTNSVEEIGFAGAIHTYLNDNRLLAETLMLDAGSSGRTVATILEEKVSSLVRVLWGNPCFKKLNKERFINLRAQSNVYAARAIREGRLTFDDSIPKHIKVQILDEASRIPFHYDEKARFIIEKKEIMRKEGIPSPDIWDAICFFFLEGAYYSVNYGGDDSNNEEVKKLAEMADDYFDSIDA